MALHTWSKFTPGMPNSSLRTAQKRRNEFCRCPAHRGIALMQPIEQELTLSSLSREEFLETHAELQAWFLPSSLRYRGPLAHLCSIDRIGSERSGSKQ